MDIKVQKTEDLIPYEKNPRHNEDAITAVAKSIEKFGFKVPIVVDASNVIVNEHTRLKAAKYLGLKEVPTIIADDLTPEQIKAFRLADNKVGEIATWDEELLNAELDELADLDFDMTEFGFDLPDIEGEEVEVIEDEFEEELPAEPISKLGDIYQLGRHRLMCGDSTNSLEVEKLMGNKKADLLITDPPYNVAYEGKGKEALTIKNDSKETNEFHSFLYEAFSAAINNMKLGSSFYVWYASSEVVNFHTALEEAGFLVKQELIWNKNSMVLSRQDYHWKHEPCLYGWASGGSHSWYSDRKQTTILNFDRPTVNKEHPTMKPVALFDYQIKNSSKQGDCILDLFGGSGTTLIACEQNEREAYLMELDPRYVDVIIARWEAFTGEVAVKISGNDTAVVDDG
ncbi:TPA: ParB N-terminal domain-containing protein [Enterococcus faecalis]|uniref:DNA modification methylase n=1 Tax=Enterococcus faecalis TaxID=1351 RepID=UPI0018E7EECD|nr:DNA modification methylase [Enterococcus faecalis]MBJ0350288.1 ParB N-terminal domain-containing protein [Enterococcus faecalis]MBJ0407300.1 ParB N-terminal domain-containing protein [Enterococcus faecalis]MBJ0748494.1 ParB N-terminal domain-containing protein [Enterococcus faecalis]MBJ1694984.1 ParB N-terminal domain-containing protein [Enterococcus faecalis]MCE2553138.1 ParB N-terminal domain-containing protein [Enterococcus faecalis]